MFLYHLSQVQKSPGSTLLISLVKKLRPIEIASPPAFPSVYNYSRPCPEFNANKQQNQFPASRVP